MALLHANFRERLLVRRSEPKTKDKIVAVSERSE